MATSKKKIVKKRGKNSEKVTSTMPPPRYVTYDEVIKRGQLGSNKDPDFHSHHDATNDFPIPMID